MKISPRIRAADAKEMRRQGERAFTMVEIAIAIGVIGFALVAIIGILPTGMNVQKDNREDTVISQDAPYFLDAIRNGLPVTNIGGSTYQLYEPSGQGLDFLTNYVQSIVINYYSNGVIIYTTNFPNSSSANLSTLNGEEIIGLLSTPQVNYAQTNFASNYFDVFAYVRALSGPASMQQYAGNATNSVNLNSTMAFTYKMEVMVTPYNSFAPDTTNYINYLENTDSNQWIIRSNRWMEATLPTNGTPAGMGTLGYNLFDVRLRFSWPVNMSGTNVLSIGPGRQTYRTLVASQILQTTTTNGVAAWFFQPQQTFATQPPPNL
jgi:type II secretory pathway pseudopilin PulG